MRSTGIAFHRRAGCGLSIAFRGSPQRRSQRRAAAPARRAPAALDLSERQAGGSEPLKLAIAERGHSRRDDETAMQAIEARPSGK